MRTIIILGALLIGLNACQEEKQTTNTTATQDSSVTTGAAQPANYTGPAGVDPKVATSIGGVVDAYLQLKNALVKSDSKEAAAAGAEMNNAIGKVDMSPMNEEQMKSYHAVIDDLKEHAQHIEKKAGDLHHQREHFETMSADIEDLVKTFGGGRKLYKDFCPMAADGKGASWVSETKEIRNPYFGDKMMECGEIKEEL